MKKKFLQPIKMMSKLIIYGLTLQILFIGVLSARGNAQGVKSIREVYIDLVIDDANLEEVFNKIERVSDFRFTYDIKDVKSIRISLKKPGSSLYEVLEDISRQGKLYFRQINYDIDVKKITQKSEEQAPVEIIIQTRNITGKVTSQDDDEGLPGVNVIEKGTSNGTVTDVQGSYSLDISEGATLVFSSVGYNTEEVAIGNRSVVHLVMTADVRQLDELVVVGYGTVRKSDLTGSVASVRSEDLNKIPVTNLNQALQGRASGVQVKQNNNSPGGNVSVTVRGINSYMGSSSPLYVIDGIVGGNINTVSPADIESLQILKDASSTAIYGANGANGVVLITTKTGKIDKNTINFNSNFGWQKIARKMDLLNAREWAEIDNHRSTLLGLTPIWDLNNLPSDTDWQDEVYGVAPIQSYNLSSAGGQKVRYYAAANYIDQGGIIDNTDYQRYSFRINLDADINERVKVGSRLGISRFINNRMQDEDNYNSKGPASWVLQIAPVLSPYDVNGNLKPELALPNATGSTSYFMNPLHYQRNLIDRQYSTGISGSVFAEIELLKGLFFRPSLNYGFGASKDGYYKSSEMFHSNLGYKNTARVSSSDSYNWHSDLLLNYENSFGNGHNLSLLGGFIAMKSYRETINATVEDFALDLFEYHQLSAGATKSAISSGMSEKKELAYISRVNYNYKGKYLFTFNSRYDGSSIFGIDNKWGFFPSAAIAWKPSEEAFIQNLGLFHDLKLRASYGISGSEALGAYSSHARLSSFNAYNIAGQQVVGFRPTSLAVPDLQWEEVAQLDVALEASFFSGKLGFILDYYEKETSKLFLAVPVPRTSGVSSVTRNTGNIENKGVELTINSVIATGKLGWRSDFNIAFQKQEVTNIGNLDEIILQTQEGGALQVKVGQPLGSFYGLKEDGIWQIADLEGLSELPKLYGNAVKAGDIRYVDQNQYNDVTDQDRVIIGNALPKFFGGWNNSFSFGRFEATIFFDYIYGNDILNADRYHTLAPVRTTTNKLKIFKDYWTPENPSTTIPALTTNMGYYFSDGMWIEDASYFRLREVSLGYSLPTTILSKVGISSINIFVSATNLFTLTNYTGSNPDINAAGDSPGILNVEFGGYPTFRTYTTGLNITF